MSFHAWLSSIAGVGFKKGDVDLCDDLTGVQNYFDPSHDVYWHARRRGAITDPGGKPIEELSQVAAMTGREVEELLLQLIPEDKDPSTKLDRREPLRNKLRDAIASLPKPATQPRRRSRAGVSWAADAEPQDDELWGTADNPTSAEEIVRRSMVTMRKQRQQKREVKQREMREAGPPRETSGKKKQTLTGQEHLQEAWEASIRPGVTPGVGLLHSNQLGKPTLKDTATQPPELKDEQRQLLADVQIQRGVSSNRDELYLAARQRLEETGADIRLLPTKRQIAAWLLRRPFRDHARWNTSSLNGVLGHEKSMICPRENENDAEVPSVGELGPRDHRLGKGSWLGPEVDRLPLGGAPELEAAWAASVGPPKAQAEAARRAAQRAAQRGESGHWIRVGRTKEKRWVHDHDVSREDTVPHDDDWAHRQTGEDMATHDHFSELMRSQKRNEQLTSKMEDAWQADLESLDWNGLRRRAMAEGIPASEFEDSRNLAKVYKEERRTSSAWTGDTLRPEIKTPKAAVIELILTRLKATHLDCSWREELESLKWDGLRKRATAEGITTAEYEEADGPKNSDRRKAAVIDLILKRLNATHLRSWRVELLSLSWDGLRKRATAEGITTAEYEEADGPKNSDRRKAAVIDLILKRVESTHLDRVSINREDVTDSGRQRDRSTQPRARSAAAMRSSYTDDDDQLMEAAHTVVRDVKELRKAIANKDGARVVELAAGVAFVLTDKPLVIRRSLHLRLAGNIRQPGKDGDKKGGIDAQQPRLIARGPDFAAIEASGIGCKVVLEGLLVETGRGRSTGAALRVTGGCSLVARRCVLHGSAVASGQQTSLHVMQSTIEHSPGVGLSITDGAYGLLDDSKVTAAGGDGVYVSGDGKTAEVRRRKSETATRGGQKATKAAEAELQKLWQLAIKYKLASEREVASMRQNIDRGRYTVAHYINNWRRRLQRAEHGCTGERCLVCRRDIARQNLYGEETETMLVLDRSIISKSSWNGIWVANGGRVVLEGGLQANKVVNCGRHDFLSSGGGQVDGLTDEGGNPLNKEELAEVVHTVR